LQQFLVTQNATVKVIVLKKTPNRTFPVGLFFYACLAVTASKRLNVFFEVPTNRSQVSPAWVTVDSIWNNGRFSSAWDKAITDICIGWSKLQVVLNDLLNSLWIRRVQIPHR